MAEVRARADRAKAKVDADSAAMDADMTEAYAYDAIDFALDAVEEAEYAVLDAIYARKAAAALGGLIDRIGTRATRPGQRPAIGAAQVGTRRFRCSTGPPGPGCAAGITGRLPDRRPGPGSLRPDARIAVRVLSRRGAASWHATCRQRSTPDSPRSCAATRTCRTSACSPHPSAAWFSTSTTSTRRCPARGSGTSSGWWQASRSSRGERLWSRGA